MKQWTRHLVVIIATLAVTATVGLRAEDITGFSATDTKNQCTVQTEGGQYVPIEKGRAYPFGTVIKTGRNSSMVLEFSTGNTFQMLARTKITVTEDVKNPKLKIIKVDRGTVNLTLDRFPADHKLQVETPTAVCGAVGTRFVVSFEDEAAGAKSRESSFSCDKGEVYVSSRFTIDNKPAVGKTFDIPSVPAGSALVAVIHEGLENSYSDITVNRGKLDFQYGGEKGNHLSVEAKAGRSARFVCSLEKTPKNTNVLALDVKAGEVVNKKTRRFHADEEVTITAAAGPVVIRKSEVLEQPPEVTAVSDYLLAAKVEGEAHSKLVDLERDNAPQEQIVAQEQRVQVAASKATELRRRLLSHRTRRLLRQIRQAGRRSQLPRIKHQHH